MSPRSPNLRMILNEELPPEIRARLNDAALTQNRTLNDTATLILVKHLGGRAPQSGAPYRPGADRFKLMVSETLHRKVRVEAARQHGTVRGVVLSILADEFGLEPIAPTRRPRRRTQ